MLMGDPGVDKFLAWIQWAFHTGQIFTLTHLDLPGSGRAPNGAGGGTPRVNGASQTGATLATENWTAGITNIVRAGDVIRVEGLNQLITILDDGDSDGSGQVALAIDPGIVVGGSPADHAAITRTACTIRAALATEPAWPGVSPGQLLDGLTLVFRECP